MTGQEQPRSAKSKAIDYATDGWRVVRRRRIRIAAALLAAVVVIACLWPASDWLLLRIAVAQCRVYRAGPDKVAFSRTPDPDRAIPVRATPWCWREAGAGAGHDNVPGRVLLYLGERRTPSGMPRIVAVLWSERYDSLRDAFYAFCIADGGLLGSPTSVDTVRTPRNGAEIWSSDTGVRFYFGQADPADPTHFTIAYETLVNPGKGIIDGWLCENESIHIQYRNGPGAREQLDSPRLMPDEYWYQWHERTGR